MKKRLPLMKLGAMLLLVFVAVLFSFPTMLTRTVEYEHFKNVSALSEQFPVTVHPDEKRIVENAQVNDFLEGKDSPLEASAGGVAGIFKEVFAWIAIGVANSHLYQGLAATNSRFVEINAGMRKEQVANAFAQTLGWTVGQKKQFMTATPYSSLPLTEGSYAPGIYLIDKDMTPLMAQALVNKQFSDDILSHYASSTAQVVPVSQALTVASLIEREAGGQADMRLISGIIWNRLFINMNLQIDASLQYSKASKTLGANGWWPKVIPSDRFIASPYNTYQHAGLPPGPIANPSVASVLAALNPKKTSCLFYFHDASGVFHCSNTYAEHVTLLKKFYGRGK